MRIGICAPSTPFSREDAERVSALAAAHFPQVSLEFADQCFAEAGHFAGPDNLRLNTFCDMANDRAYDAVWFARGGYGACRIAQQAAGMLGDAAHSKVFMGYSDAGNLLGALYKAGIGTPTHGPMPADIRREGGEEAVLRALEWMVNSAANSLEPSLISGQKYAAFNLMTLAMMGGSEILPDLSGHILMVEEVSEYLYAFDRAMFHITSQLGHAKLAGIMLGRVSDIPENDRPFGQKPDEIAQYWCEKAGIAFLGRCEIGHDSANRVVPFGVA